MWLPASWRNLAACVVLLHLAAAVSLEESPQERLARRLRGEIVGQGPPPTQPPTDERIGLSLPENDSQDIVQNKKPSGTDVFVLVAAPRPDPKSFRHDLDTETAELPHALPPAPAPAHTRTLREAPSDGAPALPVALPPGAALPPPLPPAPAPSASSSDAKVSVQVTSPEGADIHHALVHNEVNKASKKKVHRTLSTKHARKSTAATESAAAAPALPPKFPVVSQTECALLQKAIVMDPQPTCRHVILSKNWDGCDCHLPLAPGHYTEPILDYNPFKEIIAPNGDIPGLPANPTLAPISNQNADYSPPTVANPACPYSNQCEEGNFDCVGYNSFGFSAVETAKWTSGERYFNAQTCFYIMKPYDRWQIPKKIEAFWYLQAKRARVQDLYLNSDIKIQCAGETKSDKHYLFCEDFVYYLQFECDTPWRKLFSGDCAQAPPPYGFANTASLGEVCPFECGFHDGEKKWPYPKSKISTDPAYFVLQGPRGSGIGDQLVSR